MSAIKSNIILSLILAGRVVYQADGFLEKNKNFLAAGVINLVRQSQYDMIRFLFQCPITKTGNLYSALQDTGGTKNLNHNIMKIDTKVSVNVVNICFEV